MIHLPSAGTCYDTPTENKSFPLRPDSVLSICSHCVFCKHPKHFFSRLDIPFFCLVSRLVQPTWLGSSECILSWLLLFEIWYQEGTTSWFSHPQDNYKARLTPRLLLTLYKWRVLKIPAQRSPVSD